ncbi:Aerotaxis sensor receptor protein [Rhodovulum sp. PH10]|uniref:methyl-accepting chemotaxis protein n=1 Tax=Rhodovulum sp. PH10 TaxID=1187851 RepID=UPI00027C21D7|nr:methyl-accepting chemotaxis protein [Rhodovulum sp. PH10]EJW11977.1 Aerotaxis sensor receptor protein [Rhodovulum sp. PH10]
MRKNLPVTSIEYPIADDVLIVSRTDTQGKLVYFNETFVEVSGFSEEELTGQPHNIVRHPDMPPAAFADLWDTLKAGKPWAGAVKNRRKNGDYYWVLASVTPVWANGEITGYMSIRTRLAAEQREEAERVYAKMNAGEPHGYTLTGGILRERSVFDRLSFFTRSLKARLTTLVVMLATVILMVGATTLWAGWANNVRMKSIFEDRVVPLGQLYEIDDRMRDSAIALHTALADGRAGKPVSSLRERIDGNIAGITAVWNEYLLTYLTPEEKTTADAFAARRTAYVEQAIRPGLALADAKRWDDLAALLTSPAAELFAAAKTDLDTLVAIQRKEAKVQYDASRQEFGAALVTVVVLLLAGLGYGGWLGLRTIQATLRPLARLNAAMDRIARADLTGRIVIKRDDEIGQALRNILAMQSKLGFERERQEDTERRVTQQRKREMNKIATDFEGTLGEVIETVSAAAAELEAAAHTLAETAERSQDVTKVVVAAAERASGNVQSVASASEEMTSSIDEIGRQVQESARIAEGAVEQAHGTNARVAELSLAAQRIGDVVQLITAVAEQTNLLALNATIEAARAGEAGKGFAVVAQEVKALAAQTGKATGEIAAQISGMQAATRDSVDAIKAIVGTIGRLSEISSSIAAAVQQQSAATMEISRNVQGAARGTVEVSSNIAEVERGASDTGAASSHVLHAARSLSGESSRLKTEVGTFLRSVRAG